MSAAARCLFLAAAVAAAGCSGLATRRTENKINRGPLAADVDARHRELVAAGDALWARRSDRSSLRRALSKWEQAIEIDDDDWRTYAKLSRGYFFYADAFLAFDAMGGDYPYDNGAVRDEAANRELLDALRRGVERAERGLAALSPDYEKRILRGVQPEDAMVLIDRTGIGLIYWYAANLGRWATAKGIGAAIENKDRIFRMASRVYEVAPDYFHGAADRFLGAFYAAAPAYAGGDLEKSKKHFDACIAAAPNYLGSYVLAAELYATRADAPAAFDQLLAHVANTAADALPEAAPENQIEKKKAAILQSKKATLF